MGYICYLFYLVITFPFLSDPDANLESIQTLKELSELQPFINKPDWSENVPELRQLAIENPEKINSKTIVKHFTKLRLAGMNVSIMSFFLN